MTQKKPEPKPTQFSPSELTLKNLNPNGPQSGFYKCQSEHQTPLKSFKSFQGDKLDVQAKLPGLVLPSVKSNHDSAESSDSGKNNQVLPRLESKIKVFQPLKVDQKSNGIVG